MGVLILNSVSFYSTLSFLLFGTLLTNAVSIVFLFFSSFSLWHFLALVLIISLKFAFHFPIMIF